jgi:hypothetical protein
MRRNLAGACILLGLLGFTTIAEAAGKVAGYQYYTFPDGDQPIENNVVHVIPCQPTNNDCQSIAETISTEAKKAQSELDRAKLRLEQPLEAWRVFTSMNDQFLPQSPLRRATQGLPLNVKASMPFAAQPKTA